MELLRELNEAAQKVPVALPPKIKTPLDNPYDYKLNIIVKGKTMPLTQVNKITARGAAASIGGKLTITGQYSKFVDKWLDNQSEMGNEIEDVMDDVKAIQKIIDKKQKEFNTDIKRNSIIFH